LRRADHQYRGDLLTIVCGIEISRMRRLLGRNSRLALDNKLQLYKTILKPIWTYGIVLWGTASNSNIEILQQFQNKVLRVLVNAPWYVPNGLIYSDLKVPTAREVIAKLSVHYFDRLQLTPVTWRTHHLKTKRKTEDFSSLLFSSELTTKFTQPTLTPRCPVLAHDC
jgi:hypothetical protein